VVAVTTRDTTDLHLHTEAAGILIGAVSIIDDHTDLIYAVIVESTLVALLYME
jgi:hypothetical protein